VDEKTFSSLSLTDLHTFQIGSLTKTWAGIEASLDLCCHLAFTRLGGDAHFSELPRALNKRFSLLRKVLAKASPETGLPKHGVALIDCAAEASEFRHICIHGMAMEDEGTFLIGLFERLPFEYRPTQTRISNTDIANAQIEAITLAFSMLRILVHLCRAAGLQDIFEQSESDSRLPAFLDQHPPPTKRAKRILSALRGLEGA